MVGGEGDDVVVLADQRVEILEERLQQAVEVQQVIALFNPRPTEDCYSFRMIELIASFVGSNRGVDATGWAQQMREFARRGDGFFSLNRYLFVARRPLVVRQAASSLSP